MAVVPHSSFYETKLISKAAVGGTDLAPDKLPILSLLMASNPMASNLLAMASNLLAMASLQISFLQRTTTVFLPWLGGFRFLAPTVVCTQLYSSFFNLWFGLQLL